MRGLPTHNQAVEAALLKFETEGWRVIRHNERLPMILAVKDGKIFGVVVIAQRRDKNREWGYHKTKTSMRAKWPYLDGLHFIRRRIPDESLLAVKKAGISSLKQDGWRIIQKGRKSPDALLYKDGRLVAFEMLTARKSNPSMRYTVAAKKAAYGMFDDVFVELVI